METLLIRTLFLLCMLDFVTKDWIILLIIFIFSLCVVSSRESGTQATSNLYQSQEIFPKKKVHDSVTSSPPSWCCCGNCKEMNKDKEKLCCKIENCITTSNDYISLLVEYAKMTERSSMGRPPNEIENYSDSYILDRKRRGAYQKYTEWQHGHLGKYNRVPLPSCVVWSIRAMYPSPNGKYTGFKEAPRTFIL